MLLAVIVDGKKEDTFPDKKGHKYIGYVCNNDDAIVEFTDWVASIKNIKEPTVCTLKFETVTNLDLNGSEPVIKDGLVPVIISNDGTVTKTTTDDDNWYDYNESIWANAIILTGTDTYEVGETIPEEAIESYFVWIPKYRYKLFNVDGNEIPAQEIEVEIGDYDTVNSDTECIATNKSGNIGTCTNGKWMTHPAFTSLGVNGLWVGKFETTGAINALTVKPNVTSLRNQNLSSMYNAARSYKTGLDSHMMKNTEWGAMAYLTNSKYGRPKDDNGVPTEILRNNNSQLVTGCVGNTLSESFLDICQNAYVPYTGVDEQKINNVHGSTTDNISGIYDTSGGAWEYVMGNLNNTLASSEIDFQNVNEKYYDKYTGTTVDYKILGDATGETKGWNSDYADFVSTHPWFLRGGMWGQTSLAGIFAFYYFTGELHNDFGFRIVLSPSNS